MEFCCPHCRQSIEVTILLEAAQDDALFPGAAPKRPHKDQRKRVWDCVCGLFGLQPATKTEQTRVGKVVGDLCAKNATDEQMKAVYAWCRKQEFKTFGPETLVKWFDQALQESVPAKAKQDSKLDDVREHREFMAIWAPLPESMRNDIMRRACQQYRGETPMLSNPAFRAVLKRILDENHASLELF